MSDDLRELAALAALGALAPQDAARLAEAVAEQPDLSRELELDRATVERLELVADRGLTPPDLADRLVTAATANPTASAVAAQPIAPRSIPWWRRRIPAMAGAVAAVTALITIALVATRDTGLGTPDVQAVIQAQVGQPAIAGTAALYRPNRPGGRVVVDLPSLPAAPAGHHYEVWVLRSGATAMEAVGTFATDRTTPVHLDLRLPGGGTYGALDISLEQDGGPPEHSGTSVAGATFGT